tara:strand:+ start:139 stop:351 length:213 start_codon:yes stop_codon:yes gene_type:complete
MVGWVHMTSVQKMQAVYVQAHKDLYGVKPKQIPEGRWNSLTWLDMATDKLIDKIIAGNHVATADAEGVDI